MTSKAVRGFTLIELVVVITILGILAAFAVPKFIVLDTTARIATLNGLAGSVKSAASLARSMSMVNGGAAVVMEGSTISMLNSYPDATSGGIIAAVNTSASGQDFTITPGASAAGTVTFSKVGAPTPAQCSFTYAPPSAAGYAPTVSSPLTGGC